MGRAWQGLAASMLVIAVGVGACSDDDDDSQAEDEVVTEEDYAQSVEQICAQHGPLIQQEVADASGASDAEIVAFYRADYIPRVRASMEALAERGLPTDRASDLLAVYNDINSHLVSLNNDPYGYIDRTRNGDPSNEGTLETFAVAVNEDLNLADLGCLQATNLV